MLTENKIVRTPGASDDIDQRVELNVPQDTQEFGNFNTLRTRVGHKPLAIDDEGVLISEKLATKLGVSVGDSIAIYDEDAIGNAMGEGREVRVSGIMENYVAQYVLMSPALYDPPWEKRLRMRRYLRTSPRAMTCAKCSATTCSRWTV